MSILWTSINIPFSEMVFVVTPLQQKAAFTIRRWHCSTQRPVLHQRLQGRFLKSISVASTTIKLSPLLQLCDLNDNAGELKDNSSSTFASFNQLIDTSPIADSARSSGSCPHRFLHLQRRTNHLSQLLRRALETSTTTPSRSLSMDATSAWAPLTPSPKPSMPMARPRPTSSSQQAVGQGESLMLYDGHCRFGSRSFGNSVDAFQQTVNNSPGSFQISCSRTSGNTDPDGQFISIDFDEQLKHSMPLSSIRDIPPHRC